MDQLHEGHGSQIDQTSPDKVHRLGRPLSASNDVSYMYTVSRILLSYFPLPKFPQHA